MLAPIAYRNPDGSEGTRWIAFGSLWANRSGVGYSGKVDFWPVGIDGNKVVLMPPTDPPAGRPAADPPTAGNEPTNPPRSKRKPTAKD